MWLMCRVCADVPALPLSNLLSQRYTCHLLVGRILKYGYLHSSGFGFVRLAEIYLVR